MLSSVPETMPSLDNDRAQMETDIQQSRVQVLKERMAALKDEKAAEAEQAVRDVTINDAPDGPTKVNVPVQPDVQVSAQVDNPADKVKNVLAQTSGHAASAFAGMKELAATEEMPIPAAGDNEAEVAEAPRPAPASSPEEVKRKLADVFVSRDTYSHYLGAIMFANGQKELTQKQMGELSTMVERLLKKNAKGTYVVQGFSSFDKNRTTQSDFANLKLSLKRAEVVRDALVFMGVNRENIHLEAHGIDNPYNLEQPNRRALVWFQQ